MSACRAVALLPLLLTLQFTLLARTAGSTAWPLPSPASANGGRRLLEAAPSAAPLDGLPPNQTATPPPRLSEALLLALSPDMLQAAGAQADGAAAAQPSLPHNAARLVDVMLADSMLQVRGAEAGRGERGALLASERGGYAPVCRARVLGGAWAEGHGRPVVTIAPCWASATRAYMAPVAAGGEGVRYAAPCMCL